MNKYFDHTLLRCDATASEITELCNEAKLYSFRSVCVNPSNVSLAAELLKGTEVDVCTVVGFPLGASTVESKKFETMDAISKGATEIDMVINIAKAKEKDFKYIEDEIKEVVEAASEVIVKVILETCLLSADEIVACCKASVNAGADFVKTSTGFSTGGATVETVMLMKQTVGEACEVKASGGVRSLETAKAMVEAGATRLGSSSCVNIMKEIKGGMINDTNSTY